MERCCIPALASLDGVLIIVLAVTLDVVLGEPPSRLHPVVWVGRVVALAGHAAHRGGKARQVGYGCLMTLLLAGGAFVLVWCLMRWVGVVAGPLHIVAGALLLKPALSLRALRQAALDVGGSLTAGDIEQARARLCALVSRDTSHLNEPGAVSAVLESTAENLSDSFVAPLFYFVLLGVPGAAAYRVVNTLDAMVGYHGRHEYLGKCAARLDDVVNFVPARISALLLVLAAAITRSRYRAAWQIALRDHGETESPNAGWPMGAMAGALGVRLEKVGFYRLGSEGADPALRSIHTGIVLTMWSAGLWLGICVAMEIIWSASIP
ncbi:MAG: cobalamin biosynthesis protein [Chloroflexota bacterium]